MIGERMANWIIGVVTGIWAVNFLVGLVPQFGYEPDQAINGIFMAIVGGAFALRARESSRKQQNGNTTPAELPPAPPDGGGG